MTTGNEAIKTIFDADNHYWETSDAFTRYRDPKFAERGVRLVDLDGNGKPRYVIGDRIHPILPGPGDVHPRPRPGALYDYFAGKSDKARLGDELSCEDPKAHPEWFDRDARLRESVGGNIGFFNPVAYAKPGAFNDITQGTNGTYNAGKGWDAVTGLGSPDGDKLAAAFKAHAAAAAQA